MSPKIAAWPGTQGITDYSVLMQIRALVLNDLAPHLPADFYSLRAIPTKLVIYESENLDRLRHKTRLDFDLAKKLVEDNDTNPTFTPREVSATEVLNALAYFLMFLGLDESARSQNRLHRMVEAEARLRAALTLYVRFLSANEARPLLSALAVSRVSPTTSPHPVAAAVDAKPIAAPDDVIVDAVDDWKMQCQAEAYEQWARLRATGANPSVKGISAHVAQWCQQNNIITSGFGKNPSRTYLKTHVLGGGVWTHPLAMSVEAAKAHVAQAKIMAQDALAQVAH